MGNTHSSQDSLSRKSSKECESGFTSRRPSANSELPLTSSNSRIVSENLAETIKDIENRVKVMSETALRTVVDDDKWSTLEKKYGNNSRESDIRAKKSIEKTETILPPKSSVGNSGITNQMNLVVTTNERPKELTFGPRKSSKTTPSPGSKTIRELTERWESRSSLTTTPTSSVASNETVKFFESQNSKASFFLPSESEEWESFEPNEFIPPAPTSSNQSTPKNSKNQIPESTNMIPSNSGIVGIPDRKYSVPINFAHHDVTDDCIADSQTRVKMRGDNNGKKNNVAPSRPSSLIETGAGTELKVFEMGHLGDHPGRHISASTSRGSSQADLLECSTSSDTPKSPLPFMASQGSSSRELLDVFGGRTPMSEIGGQNESHNGSAAGSNRRCVSVNDIRRAFEKAEQSLQAAAKGLPEMSPCHNRMSSLDSTNSDESSIPTPQHCYGSVSSLISGQTNNMRDHYGSISSLASSTSLISQQELQGLIDEANQSLEESGTPSYEIMVIVLHREFTAGSIGITLAGGADYESKDITVHKVIPGTLADRDGRIQKGDRVLSINGKSTKGVTHREALSILKAPRAEVVLVISRSRSVTPAEGAYDRSEYPSYNYLNSGRPPKILESPLDSKSLLSDLKFVDVPRGPPKTVVLKKEGTGLGFSLEGGKDSPLGDRPLTIKKIFSGKVYIMYQFPILVKLP